MDGTGSGASGNADEVASFLDRLVDSIRFDAGVGNRLLAKDMAEAMAVGILKRTISDQESPDGDALAANRGRYGRRKAKQGLLIGVGLRKDPNDRAEPRMLSVQEIMGRVEISDEGRTLTMSPGTTVKSRRKSQWFTNGSAPGIGESSGAKGQPPRRYYGLDRRIVAELIRLSREHVRQALRELRKK